MNRRIQTLNNVARLHRVAPRPDVYCPHCGFKLFDGLVIKSRILRVLPDGAEAKCKCKRWVAVPIGYLAR